MYMHRITTFYNSMHPFIDTYNLEAVRSLCSIMKLYTYVINDRGEPERKQNWVMNEEFIALCIDPLEIW